MLLDGATQAAMSSFDTQTGSTVQQSTVQIRMQQRNGKKSITTLSGLDQRLDFDRLAKEFKKRWGCNGIVVSDPEFGFVIQLQGDQREHLREFLITEKLVKADDIRTSGM